MHKKNKIGKVSTDDERYDWVISGQSYLLASSILAKQLLNAQEHLVEHQFLNSQLFKKSGFPPHPSYEIIAPIIYNLRHGIELWLKALKIVHSDEYSYDHDLKNLLGDLISTDSVSPETADSIRSLWPIIADYYSLNFIRGFTAITDKDNIIFRFPNSDSKKRLNKIESVDINLVRKLADDPLKINSLFRKIYLEIGKP